MGMNFTFVNRICPNCKDPNNMVLLGGFSKPYKYKCMNCRRYFNDIDFEVEYIEPVWKSECMNKKVDMVEVVRCKDCKKRYTVCCIQEEAGNINNQDDWFCADGERMEGENK